MTVSDFRLLGDFKSVVDLDTQVPHGRLQLGVAEQKLHGSEVLGASIDQRRLCPSHRMCPVLGTVKAQLINPVTKYPGVLPSSQVGRIVEPAREKVVIGFQCRLLDPSLQGLPGDCRDLELHRALGLVLHDDGSGGHLITMGHITHFERNQVTSAKLTVDAEVEECELTDPTFHLKTYSQGPDVLHLEGSLLPDDLVLVPRLMMNSSA